MMAAKKSTIIFSWRSVEHDLDEQIKRKAIGGEIVSPPFSSNLHDSIKWCLVMYPKGFDKTSANHVALYCKILLDNQNTEISKDYAIKADIFFSLEYNGTIQSDATPFSHVFDKSSTRAGTKQFCPKNNFLAIVERFHYNIRCEINAEINMDALMYSQIDSNNIKSLCQDFEKLMNNSDYSDVSLVVSGKNIPAHKAILSTRSSVFDALFKNEMKESKENVVHIKDTEFDAVIEMLRFIYTGKPQDLDKLACEVLSLSDQYALLELKEACECVLLKNIANDNAISVLILADRHSANNLKKITLNFIKNNLKSVIDSQDYTMLEQSHSSLISEILRSVAS